MNPHGDDTIVSHNPADGKSARYRRPAWLRAYPTVVAGVATLVLATAELIRALHS